MKKPLLSVITWDAGFREFFHTVDYFSQQTLDKDKYEFIWTDYYASTKPELTRKIETMQNGRTFCYAGKEKWHLGQCINAAIRESNADLLVIPDGDIAVEENFLQEVLHCYETNCQKLVLYFRRWDEPKPAGEEKKDESLQYLREVCQLNNPTNYGGCLVVPKECFELVQGYEEHELFSEAGAIGMELYVRLKNSGAHIMWHPTHKIYHPWHTGSYPNDPEYRKKVDLQNWVIRQRDLRVISKSDSENVDQLIQEYLRKNQEEEAPVKKKKSFLSRVKAALTP